MKRIALCRCCNRTLRAAGRGLCSGCLFRSSILDHPERVPTSKEYETARLWAIEIDKAIRTERRRKQAEARREAVIQARRDRLEDFEELTVQHHEDPEMVAQRLGCSLRTIQRDQKRYAA